MDLTKVALRLKGLPISENETVFVDLINRFFDDIFPRIPELCLLLVET